MVLNSSPPFIIGDVTADLDESVDWLSKLLKEKIRCHGEMRAAMLIRRFV